MTPLPTEEPSRLDALSLGAIDPDYALFAGAGVLLTLAVAAESALRNYRRNRLERLVPDEGALARLDRRLERSHELLDALLYVRLAATSALVLGAVDRAVVGALWERIGAVLGAVGWVLVAVLLVAYGVVRRAVRAGPERSLLLLLPFVRAADFVFTPVRVIVGRLVEGLARVLGVGRAVDDDETEFRDNVLDAAAAGESAGVLEEDEREMIENLIEFKDQAVSAVMTPRTRIVSLPVDMPFEDAVRAAHDSGHSRIPVHDGTVDKITGLLFVKDLLKHWGKPHYELPSLKELARQVPYVPETKLISELLREFQNGMVHMAIVLDEYGGTAGLVTLEDLMEEIVGEIHDELDQEEAAAPDPMVLKGEHEAEVSALMRIDELNTALNLALPEDGSYETLGGFLFTKMGRIPQRGETYEHESTRFEILDGDDRTIRRVRVLVGEPG
jgi:CBS domain containing-hemolysin-like protein